MDNAISIMNIISAINSKIAIAAWCNLEIFMINCGIRTNRKGQNILETFEKTHCFLNQVSLSNAIIYFLNQLSASNVIICFLNQLTVSNIII